VASKKNYIAGLDGLRLFAILAVVVFHANPSWLPGGYSGVTVFFVISGYLLTLSIDRALAEKGSFSYLEYLRRRIMRLLPAMLAVVGVVAIRGHVEHGFARSLRHRVAPPAESRRQPGRGQEGEPLCRPSRPPPQASGAASAAAGAGFRLAPAGHPAVSP